MDRYRYWYRGTGNDVRYRGPGACNKVLCRKPRPEVQTLTLLNTIFDRQRYGPFRLPSIHKWYPFQKPSLECCIPYNFCKFTVSSLGACAAGFSQERIAVACGVGKRSEAQPSKAAR